MFSASPIQCPFGPRKAAQSPLPTLFVLCLQSVFSAVPSPLPQSTHGNADRLLLTSSCLTAFRKLVIILPVQNDPFLSMPEPPVIDAASRVFLLHPPPWFSLFSHTSDYVVRDVDKPHHPVASGMVLGWAQCGSAGCMDPLVSVGGEQSTFAFILEDKT